MSDDTDVGQPRDAQIQLLIPNLGMHPPRNAVFQSSICLWSLGLLCLARQSRHRASIARDSRSTAPTSPSPVLTLTPITAQTARG